MKLIECLKVALASLPFLFCSVERAHAQTGWQPETLSNLSQLYLQVDKENCAAGSSVDQLQRGVTYHLTNSGVPVVESSSSSTENRPRIELDVTCSRQFGEFTYLITVDVSQPVVLNGVTIEAKTYSAGSLFGRSDTFHFNSNEADFIIEVLSTLVTDWNATH